MVVIDVVVVSCTCPSSLEYISFLSLGSSLRANDHNPGVSPSKGSYLVLSLRFLVQIHPVPVNLLSNILLAYLVNLDSRDPLLPLLAALYLLLVVAINYTKLGRTVRSLGSECR